jgi:lipoprotein-anchoring transpeptidase ErfK/SrfK
LSFVLSPVTTGGGAYHVAVAQETTSDNPDATPEETVTDPVATETPTDVATETPTEIATESPTEAATAVPTDIPSETAAPTETPVDTGTPVVTESPTDIPTATPTKAATKTPTATPTEPEFSGASLSDITITVDCRSDPELTRIDNHGSTAVTITTIKSLINLTGGEPFTVNRKLGAGKTVIFRSGSGATYGTILTTSFIYTNTAYENDGARINFGPLGGLTRRCPPKPPAKPKPSLLSVTIVCNGAPEKTIIKNVGLGPVTLATLRTTYGALGIEPFTLNRVLNPGSEITYQSGANTTSTNRLTTQQIYTEGAGTHESVVVQVSTGKTFWKACPPAEHWIEVNLSQQRLYAWEGIFLANTTLVSTGRPGFETPTGTFYINSRYRWQTMSGCIQGECYYVPDIPFVQYFTYYGHALHGTYWHNNFGHTMSHGCVNLPTPFAEWLWYWANIGTRVVVHY